MLWSSFHGRTTQNLLAAVVDNRRSEVQWRIEDRKPPKCSKVPPSKDGRGWISCLTFLHCLLPFDYKNLWSIRNEMREFAREFAFDGSTQTEWNPVSLLGSFGACSELGERWSRYSGLVPRLPSEGVLGSPVSSVWRQDGQAELRELFRWASRSPLGASHIRPNKSRTLS